MRRLTVLCVRQTKHCEVFGANLPKRKKDRPIKPWYKPQNRAAQTVGIKYDFLLPAGTSPLPSVTKNLLIFILIIIYYHTL